MYEEHPADVFREQFEESATEAANQEHQLSLKQKFLNVWQAARYDFQDGDRKKRKLASCLGFMVFQGIGQTKLPSAAIPLAAAEVLEKTGCPSASGLAAAAIYGACTFIGLESINDSISQFPHAFEEVGNGFPSIIKETTRSLPGFEVDKPKEALDDEPIAKKIGSTVLTHGARGVMAYFAASAYVVAAGMDGRSQEMRRKLSAKVSSDGAAIVGLSMLAVGQAIVAIGEKHPVLANQIQGYEKNPIVAYGLVGGMVVMQWLRKSGVRKIKNWLGLSRKENIFSEHTKLALEQNAQ